MNTEPKVLSAVSSSALETADRTAITHAIEYYRATLLPVILFDNNSKIVFVTNGAACLFGESVRTCVLFSDFIQHYIPVQSFNTFSAFITNKNCAYSWMGTLTIPSVTAGSRYIRTTVQPVGIPADKPLLYAAIFQNDTDEYITFIQMTFTSILEAARLKDNETGVHNQRLNYYARVFTEYLNEQELYPQIDNEFVEDISFLAAMHDVGKIGTPDAILKKNGPLTEWEWEIMKEHTINGPFILATYPNPMAKQIALSHHEHWDGNGYPYKLEGEMIPLAARIVAICDVYDALRMKRNYKDGLPHDKTVKMILAESGTHFDPSLINEFKHIHTKFEDIWNTYGDAPEDNTTVQSPEIVS